MNQQREIRRLRAVAREYEQRLKSGRDYLMSVEKGDLTVGRVLYAFGWDEDGVNVREECDRAY